jgi:hypothetical protein
MIRWHVAVGGAVSEPDLRRIRNMTKQKMTVTQPSKGEMRGMVEWWNGVLVSKTAVQVNS